MVVALMYSVPQNGENRSRPRYGIRLIHLYGDLGVKDLLAERAVVQDKRVHVQQVFLQVVYRGELLIAALAHILRRRGGVVHRQVLEQRLLGFEVLLVALRTGLAPQQHLQVGLQVGLETLKAGEAQVALVARVVAVAPRRGGEVPAQPVAFRGGDLYVGGGGAQVGYLCLPFVVGQRDVLVVLLDVLGELEERAEDGRVGAVRAGVNLCMDNDSEIITQ